MALPALWGALEPMSVSHMSLKVLLVIIFFGGVALLAWASYRWSLRKDS